MLVWDHQGDWASHGYEQITDFSELVKRLRSKGGARLSFKGRITADSFSRWAMAAYLWGQLEPCTVVAEELADVTNPGKAPEGWGTLVRGGLKYGIDILAITQRPQESDKTIMGNASVIRCFRMQRATDRKYMANEMDVPIAQIEALQPGQSVQVSPGTPAGTDDSTRVPKT